MNVTTAESGAKEAMVSPLLLAGTVVLLRDTRSGPETLMIRRPDRGSFPGAWVFPGGKVEDADRIPGGDETETAARAGVRETAEEVNLQVGSIVPLSCWEPPEGTPVRFRTWFFIGAEHEGDPVPQLAEVEEYAWLRIPDALTRHAQGQMSLVPPTWVTLFSLREFDRAAEAVTASAAVAPGFFHSFLPDPDAQSVLWAGDAEHPDSPDDLARTARHRLDFGALPWRYQRSG